MAADSAVDDDTVTYVVVRDEIEFPGDVQIVAEYRGETLTFAPIDARDVTAARLRDIMGTVDLWIRSL